MSIRLIVEVLDHWKDFGLTVGERDDLIVIAENANDRTRETYGAIHEAYVLKRVNKSAASWRIAINRLMKKKALEYAVHNGKQMRGHTGQHAVYRIAVLCPEPPHDGFKGMCTRPERTTSTTTPAPALGYPVANPPVSAEGKPTANPVEEEGYPVANPPAGVGYLAATERVSPQLTPTPLPPQKTLLSLAERLVRDSGVVADEERETFIDWITSTRRIDGPGWWRKVAENGDFADLAETWRAERPTTSAPNSIPTWCGRCGDDNPGAQFNPTFRLADGAPCPACHPSALRSNAS
ncbi:hypothetical protein [Streptomyces longwoodensis]|uniref:hypothetical protein n=1 Tax=Streptomyces longwoodensis TaxID=68231 RepID=UPI0033FE6265